MSAIHRTVMQSAWNLARSGARRFGGTPGLYFYAALLIAWREAKYPAVYHPGLGTQLWMGFVPLQQKTRKGQQMLPGLAL